MPNVGLQPDVRPLTTGVLAVQVARLPPVLPARAFVDFRLAGLEAIKRNILCYNYFEIE
jgi:hypothetical protein